MSGLADKIHSYSVNVLQYANPLLWFLKLRFYSWSNKKLSFIRKFNLNKSRTHEADTGPPVLTSYCFLKICSNFKILAVSTYVLPSLAWQRNTFRSLFHAQSTVFAFKDSDSVDKPGWQIQS